MCGGVWLDAEELERIRELFPKYGDFKRAQKAFINEVMSSSETKELFSENRKFVGKLEHLSNVLWAILGVKRKQIGD